MRPLLDQSTQHVRCPPPVARRPLFAVRAAVVDLSHVVPVLVRDEHGVPVTEPVLQRVNPVQMVRESSGFRYVFRRHVHHGTPEPLTRRYPDTEAVA